MATQAHDVHEPESGDQPAVALAGYAQPIASTGVPTIAKPGSLTLLGVPRTGVEVQADTPRDLVFAGEVLTVRYLSNGEPRLGVFRCSHVEQVIGLRDRASLLLLGEPSGTAQRGAFRARIDLEVDAMVANGSRRFRVQVRDASITGVGIETGQLLAVADVVALHMPGGDAVAYEVVRCDTARSSYGMSACDPANASGFFAALVRHARDVQARGTHDERRARLQAERQKTAAESKREAVETAARRAKRGLPPGMYTKEKPQGPTGGAGPKPKPRP